MCSIHTNSSTSILLIYCIVYKMSENSKIRKSFLKLTLTSLNGSFCPTKDVQFRAEDKDKTSCDVRFSNVCILYPLFTHTMFICSPFLSYHTSVLFKCCTCPVLSVQCNKTCTLVHTHTKPPCET